MKKKFWVALLAVTTIAVIVITTGFFRQHQDTVIYNIRVENQNPVPVKKDTKTRREGNSRVSTSSSPYQSLQEKGDGSEKVASALQVSPDNLFSHLQRLNFTRHTPAERARTRAYITTELEKIGWEAQLERFTDGINVFAQRQGTEKEAGAILVAAHYDTVYNSPGADDNATGVAVVLEIARLLGEHPTPKTLQLAFFDQEEAGLLGSKAFVTNKAHLENLHGVIVMDMIGYACHTPGCQKYPYGLPIIPPSDKGDFLAVVGDAEHLSLLHAFQSQELKVLTLPIPLKGLLTPDTLRSDHAPFWYQGVGAVLVTDTANLRTPHYHQPSDVPATIDREFFARSAQIVLNATVTLLERSDGLDSPASTSPQTEL